MKTKKTQRKYFSRTKKALKKEYRQILTKIQEKGNGIFYTNHYIPEEGLAWCDFWFVDPVKKLMYSVALTTRAYIISDKYEMDAVDFVDADYEKFYGEKRKCSLNLLGGSANYDKSGHIVSYTCPHDEDLEAKETEFVTKFYGLTSHEGWVRPCLPQAWRKMAVKLLKADGEIEVPANVIHTEEYDWAIGLHANIDVEYLTEETINKFIADFLSDNIDKTARVKIKDLKGIEGFMVEYSNLRANAIKENE